MRKVMLVTGGARGIGAAVATLAAERGYDVAVAYREQQERAEEVARSVRRSGGQALT